MEIYPASNNTKAVAPPFERIPQLRPKPAGLRASALQAGEQHRVLGQCIAIAKQASVDQCPMKRNNAGGRFRFTIAIMAELEMPDAISLLDIGHFQLRHLFKPAAGISRYQGRPRQGGPGLMLGWRGLEFGISKQRGNFFISESLIMDGVLFDALAFEGILRRLLAPDCGLEDCRK